MICPAWKNSVDGDPTSWADRYKAELAASLREAGVVTGEQIKAGLGALRKSGRPFLPSPGGFAKLCIGKNEEWQYNTAAYKPYFGDSSIKRICHKRSQEENDDGINKINQIREYLR